MRSQSCWPVLHMLPNTSPQTADSCCFAAGHSAPSYLPATESTPQSYQPEACSLAHHGQAIAMAASTTCQLLTRVVFVRVCLCKAVQGCAHSQD